MTYIYLIVWFWNANLGGEYWRKMAYTTEQKFCEGWQTSNEDLTNHYGYRLYVGSGTPTIERVTCQVVPQVEKIEVVKP